MMVRFAASPVPPTTDLGRYALYFVDYVCALTAAATQA